MKRKGYNLVQLSIYAVAIAFMLMVLLPRDQGAVKATKVNSDKATIDAIVIAIQDYHYEVKEYPSTLASLTVKNGDLGPWLQVLPKDNFGNSFIYTYTGTAFAVWSCGPDGMDNTGAVKALSESFVNDDFGRASK